MKKIIIYLITLFCLLSTNSIFAETTDNVVDMKISINENGDSYTVEFDSSLNEVLKNETPTMKVVTDYTVAEVKNQDGQTISSSVKDGEVSFKVNKSGIYTITENNVYDDSMKEEISSILENDPTINFKDVDGNDIVISGPITFKSEIKTVSYVSPTNINKFKNAYLSEIDEKNIKEVKYFDISCVVCDKEISDLGEDGQELINFEFNLPITLERNQSLKLFRLHNGTVKELPITSFKNGKVKFKCSHFSVFGFVVYDKNSNNDSYEVPNTGVY